MYRYIQYVVSIALLQPLLVGAQDISNAPVQQMRQSMQSSIKGTLDGVVQIPQFIQNKAQQYVFPHPIDNAVAVNPWSQTPMQPRAMHHHGYNSVPNGNPWAPLGDRQDIPFDQTNMMGFEKNPYNDSGVPQALMNRQAPLPSGMYNNPYRQYQRPNTGFGNGYSNRGFDGSNGSFSSPFNNGLFPTNQFWPSGNNANGNFPFMPW